jgi:hypothetical protein
MAHGNTVLAQVLQLIPRAQIEALDQVHGTGRPSRVLRRWSQFGALVFAQLAGRHSLRDVVCSLAAQAHALAPLGLAAPPAFDPRRSQCKTSCGTVPRALYDALYPLSDSGPEAPLPLQKSPLFPG